MDKAIVRDIIILLALFHRPWRWRCPYRRPRPPSIPVPISISISTPPSSPSPSPSISIPITIAALSIYRNPLYDCVSASAFESSDLQWSRRRWGEGRSWSAGHWNLSRTKTNPAKTGWIWHRFSRTRAVSCSLYQWETTYVKLVRTISLYIMMMKWWLFDVCFQHESMPWRKSWSTRWARSTWKERCAFLARWSILSLCRSMDITRQSMKSSISWNGFEVEICSM